MRRHDSKPLGILVVLGGLLLMALLSQLKLARTALVAEDFRTVQGMYLGQAVRGKSRQILIETQAGIEGIYLDPSVRFQESPRPGDQVELQANVQDDTLKLVRAEDLKPMVYTKVVGDPVEMLKGDPTQDWTVRKGHALNGGYQYKTSLPDGQYATLHGVKVNGEWIAYD